MKLTNQTYDTGISNDTFSSAINEAKNYYKWINSIFLPYIKNNVLEIGVGHGGTYPLFKDMIDSYTGCDIDERLVTNLNTKNAECRYYTGDITKPGISKKIKDDKFDTVLCMNVIEHIDNDLAALKNLIFSCKPSGYILLFVPAFNFLYNDMDTLAGHFRRYRKKDIYKLVAQTDTQLIKLEYFNSIGGLGWFFNKFTTHVSLDSEKCKAQIKIFDRYILPFSKLINPITKHIFGQSVIAVLKKQDYFT